MFIGLHASFSFTAEIRQQYPRLSGAKVPETIHPPPSARPTSPPAQRRNNPLSPHSQKMLADLQLASLGERTQESYLRSVRKFAQWLDKAPYQATENALRRYPFHIKNDQQWKGTGRTT